MKSQRKISFRAWAAAALACCAAAATASASVGLRAPALAPEHVFLPAPKAAGAAPQPSDGRMSKVGDVRPLAKVHHVAAWHHIEGGYVAHVRAESATAQGLRVRLDLGTLPGPIEIRAQGGDGRVEAMVHDPHLGNQAWTPWTDGSAQLVELFSPVAPSAGAVGIGALVHFTRSPMAKAALSCTISTSCTTGEAALDAMMEERKKSVARVTLVSGSQAFVCSATLIDTPRNPAAYLLTANHCAETAEVASSIASFWFYETTPCNPPNGRNPNYVQVAGGTQLVFGNPNVDAALLLMNSAPPAGVAFAPLDPARVVSGTSAFSISHPDGDTSRWALGAVQGEYRPANFDQPYDAYVVNFTRGMIEGGSSGSGLFVRKAARLELAGVLSLGPTEATCETTSKFGVYGRLEVLYPQMAQYIGASSPEPDDAPNRPVEARIAVGPPLDTLAQPITLSGRIDYAGDIDIYRFTLGSTVAVTAHTSGSQDLIGAILDAQGKALEANDDAQTIDNNAGITRVLDAGTYYLHVAHWQPAGTGPYGLSLRADRVDTNHTALWWNELESGWGLNVNHQGDIVFATLFTYEDGGAPMWLVMSRGERQPDGSYAGALHRTTGPAFNASPWSAVSAVQVGTMRIAFSADSSSALLAYTVNGRPVSKQITRQLFKRPPQCAWSAFDRSFESNFTDLWWNQAESGWGVNLTHQENTIFATLFTYAPDGKGLWLVMPEGARTGPGEYSGTLHRTRGPAFDASPWTPITSAAAGTMTLQFSNGNAGTLTYTLDGVPVTKKIERQVFSTLRTKCD